MNYEPLLLRQCATSPSVKIYYSTCAHRNRLARILRASLPVRSSLLSVGRQFVTLVEFWLLSQAKGGLVGMSFFDRWGTGGRELTVALHL